MLAIYQSAKLVFNPMMALTNDEIRKLNLKILIAEVGKKSELAAKADTDPAYISQVLSTKSKSPRNIGDDFARKLEAACNKDRGWMDVYHDNSIGNTNAHYTLPLGPFRKIPIVGTAQLGDNGHWCEIDSPVGYGDGYLEYPTKDINAYALRCVGESMKPRIKNGEFVIVEPNSEPMPGDEVLVKAIDGRVMVKTLLYMRDGRVHLLSINEMHPPISIALENIEKMHLVTAIVKKALWVKGDNPER